MYYSSKMVTEQLKRGHGYKDIKKVISIIILDKNLINDSKEYHNKYILVDKKTGSQFTDLLEINILELNKLPKDNDHTKK